MANFLTTERNPRGMGFEIWRQILFKIDDNPNLNAECAKDLQHILRLFLVVIIVNMT